MLSIVAIPFFKRLYSHQGTIDWVDVSPYMLELARKYIDTAEYQTRLQCIRFVEDDFLHYIQQIPDASRHLAIMKYTIDHVEDVDRLFQLLAKKLIGGGSLVSTLGVLDPHLKSRSTNARFLYNGEEFPDDETRCLSDGDMFTVKFFAESNKPECGYLPGAITHKWYHSEQKLRRYAEKYGFDVFIGDRKTFVGHSKQEGAIDQNVLVATKKESRG